MLQPFRGLIYVAVFAALTVGTMALLIVPSVDAGFTQPFTRGLVVAVPG